MLYIRYARTRNEYVLPLLPSAAYLTAKIMQTRAKKACFPFAECSLSYAKIMQTRAKKACFPFAECSLSYAKIMQTCVKRAKQVDFFALLIPSFIWIAFS